MPALPTFGERLRWLRKREGLTLAEFGARVGSDQSYLSRLETGIASNPSLEFLRRVATVFSVPAEWLNERAAGTNWIDRVSPPEGVDESPVGTELEEATQFTIAINLCVEQMTSEQILQCVKSVLANERIHQKAKHFWLGILVEWAAVKSEIEEKQRKSEILVDGGDVVRQELTKVLAEHIPDWNSLVLLLRAATKTRGAKARLARMHGITRQSVNAWLTGKAQPSADTTLLLLRWILGGVGEQQKKRPGRAVTRPGLRPKKEKSHVKEKPSSGSS